MPRTIVQDSDWDRIIRKHERLMTDDEFYSERARGYRGVPLLGMV